ncbi:hypothetical protein MCANUFG1_01956 [Mycoplasmopsis canis UFG1]|uniref:SGNH/GDSL hydrolase family protein n=1 Tax=Mycoplasmopsis canis TaxID=29555 RepID=UPI00025B0016|nr:SGNH/GDSL hydrolase family protein [Mycoplasmopsis canis]EIE41599.1 hypothetical protein MCANUFG1_01956 [Mycoplasmopsis canis UFG1]
MKKRKNLLMSMMALAISASIVTACKAPGSSEPIKSGGSDIKVASKDKVDTNTPGKPSGAISPVERNNGILGGQNNSGNQTSEIDFPRKRSKNFISANTKIKYVAIGDSITAGFDGSLPEDYKGKLEKDGSISGLSYASYLARMLNQNQRIASFDNFAVSGSRTLDWIKLFEIEYPNTPSDETIERIFPNHHSLKADIIKKLQESNLITFTLGANDFFGLFFETINDSKALNIINKFLSKKPVLNDAIVFINKLFQVTLPEIKNRLVKFIQYLKEIAPHSNINLISYPMPMQMLFNILNEYISKELFNNSIDIKAGNILSEVINDNLKQISEITSINYIQAYNPNFWTNNAKEITSIFFDIHPGTKGYKKLATDIYLKITKENLNEKYYSKYDFNKEYLKSDSNTAEYQIEVTNSDEVVIGKNSLDFMNKVTDYENHINSKRSPYNFAKRISGLTKIFDHYVQEVFGFLTDNNFYNSIDPQGMLKNILLKKSSHGGTFFSAIISKIIASENLNNILGNIQNQINALIDQNNLNLETLKKVFVANIINLDNIALVINTLAESELINNDKNEISSALKNVVSNIIANYKTNIVSLIASPILDKLKGIEFNKEEFSNLLEEIISSSDFRQLIDKFIDIFIFNSNDFKDLSSITEFIKAFFKNDQNNTEIAKLINDNLKNIIQNAKVQTFVSNLIFSYLESNHLSKGITSEQINLAVADIFKLAQNLNEEFNIINLFIKNTLNELSIHGIGNISNVIPGAILGSLQELFSSDNTENNIVKLVKTLANSDLAIHHNGLLKQLIINLFEDQNISKFSTAITSALLSNQTVAKYVTESNLNSLVSKLMSFSETKSLLTSAIDSTITNYEAFKNITSTNEIILKVLGSLDFDSIKTNSISLVNNTRNSDEFKNVVKDILIRFLFNYIPEINDTHHEFISELINDLNTIVTELNIVEPLITKFFEFINNAKTSSNFVKSLETLGSELIKVLKERSLTNPIELIKRILKKEYVQNNPSYLAILTKVLYSELHNSGLLVDLINNDLAKVLESEPVINYVDKDEIITFVLRFLNNGESSKIIEKSILAVISNPLLLDNINNPKELVNSLLINTNIKDLLKTNLKELFIDLLDEISLNKTLSKSLIELSKNSVFPVESKFSPLIEKVIPSLLSVLEKTNKYSNFVSAIFDALSSSNNIDQIAGNLLNNLSTVFDIKDINLYKQILNSPLFTEHKELLKEFIKLFISKLKENNFLDLIKNSIPDELPLGITKAELNQTLSSLAQNENLHNILNSSIDHLFGKIDELKIINTPVEGLKIILGDNTFLNSIKNDLTTFINTIKNDTTITKLVTYFVNSILKNEKYSWVLDNVNEKEKFIQNTYLAVSGEIQNLNIIEHIFSGITKFINLENNNDLNKLSDSIIDEILTEFNETKLETNIVRIIKSLSAGYFEQNKDSLIQVTKNIYNHFTSSIENLTTITNPLFQKHSSKIEEFISLNDLNSFILSLLNDESLKDYIFSEISSLFSSSGRFSDVTNISDIVLKIIKGLNKDSLKTFIKSLISKFNEEKYKTLIATILTNIIKTKYTEIYDENETLSFMKNLISDLFVAEQKLMVKDSFIDGFVDAITKDSNSSYNDLLQSIKQYISSWSGSFTNKLTEKSSELINYLFNSNIFTHNKAYFFRIIKFAAKYIIQNSDFLLDTFNNFLIQNNLLDSSNKITQSQFVKFKEFILEINDFDSNISIIDKTLSLTDEEISNINSLDSLTNTLGNKLIKAINFTDYKFVKAILSSRFVKEEKELIKNIFIKLIDKYLKENEFRKLIPDSLFNDISRALNVESVQFRDLVINIFSSTSMNNVLKKMINKLLDNTDTLKINSTYNDLVKSIFSLEGFKSEIQSDFVQIIKEQLSRTDFKNWLKTLILNFLNNESLAPYFDGVNNKDALAENIISIYDILDKRLELSNVLFDTLFEALKTNGYKLNISSIIQSLFSAVKLKITSTDNSEELVINLIKDIANSNLFSSDQNDLVIIFNNIIENLGNSDVINNIIDNLPEKIKNKILEFFPLEDLKTLANFILRNSNFKSIVENALRTLFSRINELNSISSYTDLFKKLFEIINIETLETSIKGLIHDLLNTEEIHSSLHRVLKQTLRSLGVNVDQTEMDGFILLIAQNSNEIVNKINIIDPIITKFFEKLKLAKTRNSFEEMSTDFASIVPEVSSIIQTTVTSNPKEFIDKILSIDFIRQNKNTFNSLISQLIIGLKNKGTLLQVISIAIDKINPSSPFLQILDKESIKLFINIIFESDNLNSLINSVTPELLANTEWLNFLNNPFELFKKLLSNNKIRDAFKVFLENASLNIPRNNKTTQLVLNLIDNISRKYGVNLNGINKINLVNGFLTNTIPFIRDLGLWPNILDNTINFILNSNNFNEVSTKISTYLNNSIRYNEFDLYKKFFIHFEFIKNDKEGFVNIVERIYNKLIDNGTLRSFFTTEISKLAFANKYSISSEELNQLFDSIFKDPTFVNRAKNMLSILVDNWNIFKESNSFKDLVKRVLNIPAIETQGKELISYILNKLLDQPSLKSILSRIIVREINSSSYSKIFKGISNPETMISNLLPIFKIIDKHLLISSNLVNDIYAKVKIDYETISLNTIIESLSNSAKTFFNNENFDASFTAMFKEIINHNEVQNRKNDVIQIIGNISETVFDQIDFGNLIWSSLPESAKTFTVNNLISQQQFTRIFNDILESSSIRELVNDIATYVLSNKDQFANINSILDIVKVYISVESNQNNFKTRVLTIIKNGFKKQGTVEAVRSILEKAFTFLGINNNEYADDIINKLSNGFAEFLERQQIFEKALTGVINQLKTTNNFRDIPTEVVNGLLNEVKPSDFNTIKKIFNDPLVQQNKTAMLSLVLEAIGNFLDNEQKIRDIISNLGLASVLVSSNTNIDRSLINDMLVLAVKNPDLRDALKISLSDFIERASVYNKNESWLAALNTLMKTPRSGELKAKFTNWVKSILTNPDNRLTQGVAQVLISKFRDAGIMLEFTSDAGMMNSIVAQFFRALSERRELSTIIDKIYENVKSIDFERIGKENIKLVKNAITNGAFSIILTDDQRNISFHKLLSQFDFLQYLIDRIGDNNYVRLIHRMFETSDRQRMTGVYAFIKNQLIGGGGGGSNQSGGGAQSPEDAPYGFSFDESIFTVVERTKKLISVLFRPVFRDMFLTASTGNYNFSNPQANMHYKVLYRMAALMLWFIHDKAVSGFAFWNGTSLDVESVFVSALDDAFLTAKGWYPNQFNRLNSSQRQAVGATYSGSYNWDFIVGNRSINTRLSNYWSDQLFAYVYYRNGNRDRYSGKYMTDALLDSLRDGSLRRHR